MKFDPSKPYATVHGDNFGRVYEQDNRHFDGEGNEVIVTEKMRAEQLAREAEEAASSGDDKDAIIAALTRRLANLMGDDKPKAPAVDPRDAKIEALKKQADELEKSKAPQQIAAKPADKNDAKGLTMAAIAKQ